MTKEANNGTCEGKSFEQKPCSVEEDLKEEISVLKQLLEATENEAKEEKLNHTQELGALAKENGELKGKIQQCQCDGQDKLTGNEQSPTEPPALGNIKKIHYLSGKNVDS